MTEIEHDLNIWPINLVCQMHGVFNSIQPGSRVMVEQQLRAGILRHFGKFADDVNRARLAGWIARLEAVDHQIDLDVSAFQEGKDAPQRRLVTGLTRSEVHDGL